MSGDHPLLKWATIILFVAANVVITLAMVIAPAGSDIATNANLYKGASFFFGCIVLWLSYRKNNFFILLVFTALQWVAFTRVMNMLNAA